MISAQSEQAILMPDGWPKAVKSALLHVISLAHWAVIYSRSWAANSPIERVRLAGRLERAENEIALLREEIRIKNARMIKIPAKNRPFYPPLERMAILELRAARGWSLAQTARIFLLDPETVSSWIKRIDEQGEKALVRVPEPLNKFPDFVRHVVSRLKVLCPAMGKKRIAQVLARAGMQLSATTVGRMLAAPAPKTPPSVEDAGKSIREPTGRVVTARHPNHVWHVDLTLVPILPRSRAADSLLVVLEQIQSCLKSMLDLTIRLTESLSEHQYSRLSAHNVLDDPTQDLPFLFLSLPDRCQTVRY